ncbi:hypothetical protein OH76DRAFT_1174871 [Lentinus brumalis]|uniref:Uncharacterized protein n=1 Tax=Lentinus brumalis TaxID=2498619 RepID=A0A371CU30_9APHY|nr:hypothetical protein OH76DRAFT_1174871 [Polyporus brumalis]
MEAARRAAGGAPRSEEGAPAVRLRLLVPATTSPVQRHAETAMHTQHAPRVSPLCCPASCALSAIGRASDQRGTSRSVLRHGAGHLFGRACHFPVCTSILRTDLPRRPASVPTTPARMRRARRLSRVRRLLGGAVHAWVCQIQSPWLDSICGRQSNLCNGPVWRFVPSVRTPRSVQLVRHTTIQWGQSCNPRTQQSRPGIRVIRRSSCSMSRRRSVTPRDGDGGERAV